ncbi:MAG: HlyD family efflux transporter periplasmic adaptor subunit [Patescibacteria group bacterium]
MKRHFTKKRLFSAGAFLMVTGTIIGTQFNKTTEDPRYILASVSRGTVVTTVTGSGQVSAENQIDIMPKVSGTLARTFINLADEVTTDTPLFAIEQKDAAKTVRNAEQSVRDSEISLEAAQILYEKLIKPESNSNLLQAQNSYNQAERSLNKLLEGPDELDVMTTESKVKTAEQNAKLSSDGITPKIVRDSYDNSVNTMKNLTVTLQKSLDDANSILAIEGSVGNVNFANLFSALDQSKKIQARMDYDLAKMDIASARSATDLLAINNEDISKIDTARSRIKIALDSAAKLLNSVKAGLEASLTSSSFSQSSLDQYKSTIQSDLSSVTNAYATIKSLEDNVDKAYQDYDNAESSLSIAKADLAKLLAGTDADQITQAREALAERKQALDDAKLGADDIEIKTAKNTIKQRESSLQNARDTLNDAYETLNDYTVRAPFNGIIAKLDAQNANQVSPSTALATLITKSKIAKITLNEVDVAKVAVGQKVTLTFDAVPDLTIAGTVAEVDLIGTVSQNVVSYSVKIAFDTQDDRVKAGMSVSASIIIDSHVDVLMVPNGAIKIANGQASVQILSVTTSDAEAAQGIASKTSPEFKAVEVGLSDDQSTEIISGLNEGDRVVIRVIEPGATTTATQSAATRQSQSSSIRIPGLTGGGAMGR